MGMIELFTLNTPKGLYIPIALEDLGAPCVLRTLTLGARK